MSKQPENTLEWVKHFEKLRDRAYQKYQQSGEPRYDNLHHKYDTICVAFYAKLELEYERDALIQKRIANCNATIDRLQAHRPEFTHAEVCQMLREAIWW